MKKLYLVRHAKSSWNFDELDDFNRPLGKRGRNDLVKMGSFLSKEVSAPDLIMTSPASRSFYTALYLADAWKYPEEKIILSEILYHAQVQDFSSVLNDKIDNKNTVAIFGHNPGFTMFYNRHCEEYIENMPTCSIVGLEFDIEHWSDLMTRSAKRLFFYSPKRLNDK